MKNNNRAAFVESITKTSMEWCLMLDHLQRD